MAAFVQKSALALNTSPTITGVTAGDFLVLTVMFGGTISGIVDTSGQTWSSCTINTNSGSGVSTQIWYLPNANTGTHTLTLTGASSQQSNIAEFSGILTASPIDGQTGSNGASATATAGPLTPSQSGDLFIAVMGEPGDSANDGISDPPTGFTSIGAEQNGSSYQCYEACYLINSGSGAETATWTITYGAVGWAASIAAFKSTPSYISVNATPGTWSYSSPLASVTTPSGFSNGWPVAGIPAIGTLLAATSSVVTVNGTPGTWSYAGTTATIPFQLTAIAGAWSWAGTTATIPAAAISATPAAWSWAGTTASFSVEISATPAAWSWAGTTASFSVEISATPAAWSWAGTTATIPAATISSTPGVWSWAGTTASTTQVINQSVGAYSYAGTTATTTQIVNQITGAFTWAGKTATTSQLLPSSPASYSWTGTLSSLAGHAVYPLPSQVLAGVVYGPNGNDYTGTYVPGIMLELGTGGLVLPLSNTVAILM